ncbi:MAG: hypothetical protein IPM13_14980 [Phycisphaerales bacterium]|nr:hypothetical protein [Phycisphaerales bacterium]
MPRRKRDSAGAPKQKSKNGRRRPRVGRASAAPTGASEAIRSLQSYRSGLLSQRAQIDRQLAAVDAAINTMGGAAGPVPAASAAPAARRGPGRRGPRAGSLKSYIIKVLTGRGVMSVKDITQAVLDAGYPTKNQTLAKSVGIALTGTPGVQKVGRGKFRLA